MASFIRRYALHAIIGLLAALSIFSPGAVTSAMQTAASWFLLHFDWLTLGVSSLAVIACLAAALGPWGSMRLGTEGSKPEFSTLSWMSMLFAAGMGAGLVFWGAAEPLIFTVSPPPGTAQSETEAAIRQAYALTMFHWAFQAWAIYTVTALAVAYMAFRLGKPPLPSVVFGFLPRWAKILIDMIALMAVIFGVIASIGQGGLQMGAGVEIISGVEGIDGPVLQSVLILILGCVFLLSAWGGLKRGIEPLSGFNMILVVILAIFVFTVGPTRELIGTMGDMAAAYLGKVVPLSFTLRPEGAAREWTRDWSLTYFLWWIAWTPFVSVFIARVSRGRTIRQFVLGAMMVPCIVTLIWFAIMGGTAISLQLEQGVDLGVSDFSTAAMATYMMLEQLPLTLITQIVAFTLVFIFLVTSADSGAYVMAMFSARTDLSPPRWERIFWGVVLIALTIGALLSAQGQMATRAFAVVGSIPLCFLMAAQTIAAGNTIWRDWRARSEVTKQSEEDGPTAPSA